MKKISRRDFLKQSTYTAAALATGIGVKPVFAGTKNYRTSQGRR
ncbi:unnamed protein product, partial [marine sediment metagenome]